MITGTRIGAIVAGFVLAAIAAIPALGVVNRSATVLPQPSYSLELRGQALNMIFGLGHPATLTHAQLRADLIRGAALNVRFGLPVSLSPDDIATLFGTGSVATPFGHIPSWHY